MGKILRYVMRAWRLSRRQLPSALGRFDIGHERSPLWAVQNPQIDCEIRCRELRSGVCSGAATKHSRPQAGDTIWARSSTVDLGVQCSGNHCEPGSGEAGVKLSPSHSAALIAWGFAGRPTPATTGRLSNDSTWVLPVCSRQQRAAGGRFVQIRDAECPLRRNL
jgi:hypothetical protein